MANAPTSFPRGSLGVHVTAVALWRGVTRYGGSSSDAGLHIVHSEDMGCEHALGPRCVGSVMHSGTATAKWHALTAAIEGMRPHAQHIRNRGVGRRTRCCHNYTHRARADLKCASRCVATQTIYMHSMHMLDRCRKVQRPALIGLLALWWRSVIIVVNLTAFLRLGAR